MKLPALSTSCPQKSLFSIKHLAGSPQKFGKKLATRVFEFYENRLLLTRVCRCGLLHSAFVESTFSTPVQVYCCGNLFITMGLFTCVSSIKPLLNALIIKDL